MSMRCIVVKNGLFLTSVQPASPQGEPGTAGKKRRMRVSSALVANIKFVQLENELHHEPACKPIIEDTVFPISRINCLSEERVVSLT